MQTLSQFRQIFDRCLADNQFNRSPQELYAPVRYIMNLGGKRMRPLMTLMAHSVFADNPEKSVPAAFAVEVFHNFTLVHDDIMDEAPLRRGKPTVHTRFSQNHAILSGDVMLILAYQYLARTEDKSLLGELLDLFNETAVKVCEGQQNDMNFEERDDVQLTEYLEMIENKTAVLLGCALQMGAIIGGADKEDARHLYEFGRNVGLAFQMQDDLLDTYGDPEKFGKKVGGDIIQNKKTYLVLKALETADAATAQELKDYLKNVPATQEEEENKIEQVRAVFDRLQVKLHAERLKNEYQEKAFAHLAAVKAPEERKKTLSDTAKNLLVREV